MIMIILVGAKKKGGKGGANSRIILQPELF